MSFRFEHRFDFVGGEGQGVISENSRLEITESGIAGRLEHGRQSWIIDVDVTYQGIPPELAALAILTMSNNILDFHHE